MIDHDAGESDEKDNEGSEAMDVDHLARSMPPFELDHDALGQAFARSVGAALGATSSGRGSATGNATDLPRADTAFRSYTAALTASIQRSTGHHLPRRRVDGGAAMTPSRTDRRPGRRTPSTPKLVFSLNWRPLAHDSSSLSAVISENVSNNGIRSRLWSEVHVITYAKTESNSSDGSGMNDSDEKEGDGHAPSSSTALTEAGTSRLRRSRRLQENKERSSPSNSVAQRKKKEE